MPGAHGAHAAEALGKVRRKGVDPVKKEKIFYISDLHLFHLLRNKKASAGAEIAAVIGRAAENILRESEPESFILIDGDTCLNFALFELFTDELGKAARTVVFTLGNHDLWSCPEDTVDALTEKYRACLQERGMYLLQNELLCFGEEGQPPERITEKELREASPEDLLRRASQARRIFFGGVGFAGYEPLFNAKAGLYRYNKTIGFDRDIEIAETRRFEALYDRVCSAFGGRDVVVVTHMPLADWCFPARQRQEEWKKAAKAAKEAGTPFGGRPGMLEACKPGFIYVSGHTHRNYRYDDGAIRFLADNQFGYNKGEPEAWPHLKSFEV